MKKFLFVTMLTSFGWLSPLVANGSTPPILKEVHRKIHAEFQVLDFAMKATAQQLGASGLTGDGASASLAELCEKFAFAVDCAAVDPKGKMVTVAPPAYKHLEGTDIGTQEQVRAVIQRHKPIMSEVFRAVEGFDAVDVEYPVFDPQGKYIGSASLLFKAEAFFGQVLPPLTKNIPVAIWVMEKGGRIIYDVDAAEIGLNLFASPIFQPYPQLRKIGRRISASREGSGSYQYKVSGENAVVPKSAYWKTVTLYGTEWRVVGVHAEKAPSGSKAKLAEASIRPEEKLAALAMEANLVKALSEGNQIETIQYFKKFYKTTSGIYAIEWIDRNGINRFGYPAGNSLIGYDYHQKRTTGDQEVLDILASRRKSSMELPLTEGGVGVFNFMPVLDGDHYLGMIYIIRLR
ncbi:cache domain-containing protein [Desulfatirhabdium butyrativorans]|uniref:cache domain-containing protein n=1 Tax=Desulfatirhabdium butyrativorans TaxID=340467 RepID=UPI0005501E52|nr:cache domain-containing protein [Desulfatirhabdium butyrativorans]